MRIEAQVAETHMRRAGNISLVAFWSMMTLTCLSLAGLMYWLSFNMLINTEWFLLICSGFAILAPIAWNKTDHRASYSYLKGLGIAEFIISTSHFLGFAGYAISTRAIQHSDFESIRLACIYWTVAVILIFILYPIGFFSSKPKLIPGGPPSI